MTLPHNMKTAVFVVAVGMLLALVACGGGSVEGVAVGTDTPSSPVTAVVPVPTEAPEPKVSPRSARAIEKLPIGEWDDDWRKSISSI